MTKTPSDAGFVLGHYVGAGSPPAYANGNIYTIGAAGLHAFGPAVGSTGASVASWESLGGAVAIGLDAGAVEPRIAGLRTFRLTFDAALDPSTVGAGTLVITGQSGGAISTAGAVATLSSGNTVLTVTLAAALPDGDRYTIALASGLRTAAGAAITGGATIEAAALAGDVDASGAVTAADVLAVRGAAGAGGTVRCDVDGSGAVSGTDLLLVRGRMGRSLP
jgi:hypothetical protein